ncbi:hypothetical protein U1Q18_051165 [Sarracenia purpurea var. burkii]
MAMEANEIRKVEAGMKIWMTKRRQRRSRGLKWPSKVAADLAFAFCSFGFLENPLFSADGVFLLLLLVFAFASFPCCVLFVLLLCIVLGSWDLVLCGGLCTAVDC